MIVEIVGEEAKPTGPSMPMSIRIKDCRGMTFMVQIEVLDHEGQMIIKEILVSRTELCRAVRAFEVPRGSSREE